MKLTSPGSTFGASSSTPVQSAGSSSSGARSRGPFAGWPSAGGIVHVTHTLWIPANGSPTTRALKVSAPPANDVSTPVIVGGAASAGVTAATGPNRAGAHGGGVGRSGHVPGQYEVTFPL